jgi:hypothetical protein
VIGVSSTAPTAVALYGYGFNDIDAFTVISDCSAATQNPNYSGSGCYIAIDDVYGWQPY